MRTLVLVLLVSLTCFAQSVKVRIINSSNGSGLAKQRVSVQFLYEKPPKTAPPLHLETDSNGETQFSIPEPLPAHLDVRVALINPERWHCGCWMLADTKTVVDKGFLNAVWAKAKSPTAAASAEPGHVVFVARPLSFVERLLYPLTKE